MDDNKTNFWGGGNYRDGRPIESQGMTGDSYLPYGAQRIPKMPSDFFAAPRGRDNTREINAGELSAKLANHSITLLEYEVIYPRIKASTQAETLVNRYHATHAGNIERMAKNRYLPMARRQEKFFRGLDGFDPFSVRCGFQVMLNGENVMSLFSDIFISMGYEGSLMERHARTYCMTNGAAVSLSMLFARGSTWKRNMIEALERQIASEAEENPGSYYSDWRQIFTGKLNERNFYLTSDGIVIFFEHLTIANGNAGIPSFLLPYGLFNAQLNKKL